MRITITIQQLSPHTLDALRKSFQLCSQQFSLCSSQFTNLCCTLQCYLSAPIFRLKFWRINSVPIPESSDHTNCRGERSGSGGGWVPRYTLKSVQTGYQPTHRFASTLDVFVSKWLEVKCLMEGLAGCGHSKSDWLGINLRERAIPIYVLTHEAGFQSRAPKEGGKSLTSEKGRTVNAKLQQFLRYDWSQEGDMGVKFPAQHLTHWSSSTHVTLLLLLTYCDHLVS